MANIGVIAHDIVFLPGYTSYVPTILAQSNVESATGDAETIDITGSSVTFAKGIFSPGTAIRYTMAGTRGGTAGAATLAILIDATTAISIVVPSNTALDFVAQFTICQHTDMKHQNCFGEIKVNGATTYVAVDYAAATADVSQGTTIKAQATLANGADTVAIEYVLVECWQVPE